MSSFVIRRAVLSDAKELSRLGEVTFVDTFGHMYSADNLAAYLADAYNVARIEADLADDAKAMWIVERAADADADADADAPRGIGYALAGPCGLPHADVTPHCLELKRFYLVRDWQAKGVGTRLLELVDAWLKDQSLLRTRAGQRHFVWVSVWSENFGAQRFYSRVGFAKFAEYKFLVGQHQDEEFMFRRDAEPDAAAQ
jgi:GNAT superfamily N-acetyltransferase